MKVGLVGGAAGCYASGVHGRGCRARGEVVRLGGRGSWLGLLVGLASIAIALSACDSEAPRLRAVHGTSRGDEAPDPPPASAPSLEPDVEPPAAEPSREGWNEAQIHWETYEAGLARAQRESRPVLLVMSATWCGHCRTYSHVFEDERIVSRARRFVMVHIDSDVQREVADRYVVDGRYVPRTYFLAPDGTPMSITATNPRFRYFYDEDNAAALVVGMDAALAQAGG